MTKHNVAASKPANKEKCYNSWSCIFSVLIIIFVVGSIIWDLVITKPAINQSIIEINTELKDINRRLDNTYIISRDTTKLEMPIELREFLDSASVSMDEPAL